MRDLNSNPLRRPGAWLLAGAAFALTALVACDSGSGGGGGAAYTCKANDTLCIPRSALIDTGDVIYNGNCTGCHGLGGKGQPGGVPPHANADFVQQNRRKLIEILLEGYNDSIKVNGLWYNAGMPSFSELSNHYIASVLTYIHVVLNDSTVVSCNSNDIDEEGYAKCVKVKRTPQDLASDSVAVWEVKAVRDSIDALAR